MSILYKNKKAIVTMTTFSLIILAALLVLSFSYFYYDLSTKRALEENSKIELINSINSFRSALNSLILFDNSSLNYISNLDSDSILLVFDNGSIIGSYDLGFNIITLETSSLGIQSCLKIEFEPSFGGNFYYNGTCISLIN